MDRLTFIAMVLMPSSWWSLRLCEFSVDAEVTETSERPETSSNETATGC